jgi:hypothetical protein
MRRSFFLQAKSRTQSRMTRRWVCFLERSRFCLLFGVLWCGVPCLVCDGWCVLVWCGVWCAMCGVRWCGVGVVWCVVCRVWCGLVWCVLVWCGVWCAVCGVCWCGVCWCGVAWATCVGGCVLCWCGVVRVVKFVLFMGLTFVLAGICCRSVVTSYSSAFCFCSVSFELGVLFRSHVETIQRQMMRRRLGVMFVCVCACVCACASACACTCTCSARSCANSCITASTGGSSTGRLPTAEKI